MIGQWCVKGLMYIATVEVEKMFEEREVDFPSLSPLPPDSLLVLVSCDFSLTSCDQLQCHVTGSPAQRRVSTMAIVEEVQ